MSDLSSLLMQRTYSPEALVQIHDAFAPQPDQRTCGAAAVRHGLLLGGLLVPVTLLESLLEIRAEAGLHYEILLTGLNRLGFNARRIKKRTKQSTAAFLDQLRPELEQSAFLLADLYGECHWVCLGAWDGERAWVVDSYHGRNWPQAPTPSLGFFDYTEQEFDEQEWGNCITVVRPGIWANQYQAWLPARRALLRMPVQGGGANPVTTEAAVEIAAGQYLNDAEYFYRELVLYLPGGVDVTVKVEDPGEDAVLLRADGVGEGQVLVFRRASGMLTQQTPPELVIRAGQLWAVQLR